MSAAVAAEGVYSSIPSAMAPLKGVRYVFCSAGQHLSDFEVVKALAGQTCFRRGWSLTIAEIC